MEGSRLDLPLLLQAIHNILVTPTNLMRQTLYCAVLATGLQSQNSQGLGHNHSLLAIIGRGDTLEQFETLKSCRAASSLVRNHAADGPVQNLGGCAVVKGARFLRVHNVAFVEEIVVSQLVAEEAARDVDLLAPDNDYLLAAENLLRDNRSEPTQKMAFAINDDGA